MTVQVSDKYGSHLISWNVTDRKNRTG